MLIIWLYFCLSRIKILWAREGYGCWGSQWNTVLGREQSHPIRRAHITEAVCAVPQSNDGAHRLGPSLVRSPDTTAAQLCSHLSRAPWKHPPQRLSGGLKELTHRPNGAVPSHRKGHVNTSCYYIQAHGTRLWCPGLGRLRLKFEASLG